MKRTAQLHPTTPFVEHSASKFGRSWGPALAGLHRLPVSWHELVWAAMTVGQPTFAHLLAHGWHSICELIVREYGVYANLRQSGGEFVRSNLYSKLDPTEKSGVSYLMGMIAAKVLCHRLLDVPWLFHVSMVSDLGGAVTLKGKSAPDLVGLRRNGDWVVAEAKGRTLAYSAAAMSAAKVQTRQVRQVNGSFPALRVGVQAFFAPTLQWALEDPAQYDEGAGDLEFDFSHALDRYYAVPEAAIFENPEERRIGDRIFVARKIAEMGVTIAIDPNARKRIAAKDFSYGDEGSRSGSGSDSGRSDQGFAVFGDGLAVALDDRWSQERMALEPQARRD